VVDVLTMRMIIAAIDALQSVHRWREAVRDSPKIARDIKAPRPSFTWELAFRSAGRDSRTGTVA